MRYSIYKIYIFVETDKYGLYRMAKADGHFKPGNPGKPQGATNKLTKTVKETVLAVFNELQDDPKANLTSFAKKYPRDFYNIAAKLIPTELTGTVKNVIRVRIGGEDEIEDAEVVND